MTIRHAAAMALCARKYRVSHKRRTSPASLAGVSAAYRLSGTALLEQRLYATYDHLFFHSLDATTPHWRMRQDYPHHLLFSRSLDYAALAAWAPSGANPSMTSPIIQKKLNSIPCGSKVVVIHPQVMGRINLQPVYMGEILTRISDWFAFDAARADAVVPGASPTMAQAVVIGADGQIANAFSTNPGSGRIVTSKKNFNFWDKRAELHRYYMSLRLKPGASNALTPLDIKEISRILGGTIDGMPIDEMLTAVPRAAIGVWGL